jgi:hypothetical protein
MTALYRFGAISYSADDIRRIARGHGADGIGYYPPSDWGNPMPERIAIEFEPWSRLDRLYLEAYRAGYYDRHPKP